MSVQSDLATAKAWTQSGWRGPCCCLGVFTWAKQMAVSSYLCSYTPADERAPFFSRKRLANDCAGRWVTLMTSVARQPTVRQKLILKIHAGCLETCGVVSVGSAIRSTRGRLRWISWVSEGAGGLGRGGGRNWGVEGRHFRFQNRKLIWAEKYCKLSF